MNILHKKTNAGSEFRKIMNIFVISIIAKFVHPKIFCPSYFSQNLAQFASKGIESLTQTQFF